MADPNKTEKPTPHRRERARKQGQVARSRDLCGSMALAGAGMVLFWQGKLFAERWAGLLRWSIDRATSGPITFSTPLLSWTSIEVVRAIGPVLSASLGMAVLAGVMQGGMVFAGEAIVPKFERLSPSKKLQQMFSAAGLSSLLKSMLPFSAILLVGVYVTREHWAELVGASYLSLPGFCALMSATLLEVLWKSALILLAWSGVDYLLHWQKMEGELRMSRQDLRDDFKETEGSPETKARIRRIQRSLRRQQLLKATETATVVITNPTHYAVALRYEMDMEAPQVVSKGRDLLAQKIKEIAHWQHVPIMENPPLAQALYRSVDIGQTIPAKLYTAVAEILVLVYRAQAQVRQRSGNPGGGRA